METKEILRKLVSYNTIRDKENKEIMDFAEEYLKKYNFTVKRIEKCLIAYNDSYPNIGFVGHTDTVDYESWDGSPFEMQEEKDKLIGLGTCDMKGGVASILGAVSKLDLTKNKLAIYLTNDEEINFEGIKTIKDYIVPENIIIGEPTDNIPVYGTKGILELVITFFGVKCHSSTPEKGENAIYKCLNFINDLKEYYENTLKKELTQEFDIPYTTMNIGTIKGGETLNSVPGKCTITIDFRTTDEKQTKRILNKLNSLLENTNSTIEIINNVNPKLNQTDLSFLEKISSKKQTKCYITEGSFIDKNFIILGPGPDTSHQKNEYILNSSLKKTEELYKNIIEYYNNQ